MRQVANLKNLPRSLLAGTVIAACCLPALLLQLSLPVALGQGAVLWLVCVLMWQICLAWTPADLRNKRAWREPAFGYLLALTALLIALDVLLIERWLSEHIPDYYPTDWADFGSSLVWVALFNTLFVIATPYAFMLRLTRSPMAGVAAVILFSQCIAVVQAWEMSTQVVTAVALLVGLRAALLAVAYRECGFAGAALLSGCLYLRFLPSLFANG